MFSEKIANEIMTEIHEVVKDFMSDTISSWTDYFSGFAQAVFRSRLKSGVQCLSRFGAFFGRPAYEYS